MKVRKKSGKPFKSGNKIATVKGFVVNYMDPKRRLAYIFWEDDSFVNMSICEEIKNEHA